MNIFSRIKSAVVSILGMSALASHAPGHNAPGIHERRNGKLRFKPPALTRQLRLNNTRSGFKGPIFTPSAEHHHASRQTCRARLRGLFFAQFSNEYPNASRRQRRRVSRFAAQAEYRRMMSDSTNQIGDFDAAVANA